jgi:uncharacterized membrane protein
MHMNGTYTFLLARLIHVVCGVAWAGALVFVAVVLLPAIQGAGPAGGGVMDQIIRVRRLPVLMMTLAILTVLSGLSLFYLDVHAFGAAWVHTGTGRTFSLGAALAILGMIVGMSVSTPAARKLGALGASIKASGAPPSLEQAATLGRLQNRLVVAGKVVTVLVVLAVACMGVARYIP